MSGRKPAAAPAAAVALASVVLVLAVLLAAQAEGSLPGPTPPPAPAQACPFPETWRPRRLESPGDLERAAQAAGMDVPGLLAANCLEAPPPVGAVVYLPPTATPPAAPDCGPPEGWRLQPLPAGVDLVRLARDLGLDLESVLRANCLDEPPPAGGAVQLYLPAPPTATPSPTAAPTATETEPAAP